MQLHRHLQQDLLLLRLHQTVLCNCLPMLPPLLRLSLLPFDFNLGLRFVFLRGSGATVLVASCSLIRLKANMPIN